MHTRMKPNTKHLLVLAVLALVLAVAGCPKAPADLDLDVRPDDTSAQHRMGFTPTPSGTGFVHVTGGVQDSTAHLVANADVDSAAAIAGTKIAPDFGSQNVSTTGVLSCGSVSTSNISTSSITTNTSTVAGTLSLGSSPATAGDLRLTGSTSRQMIGMLYAGTNYPLLSIDGAAALHYGAGLNQFNTQIDAANLTLNAGSQLIAWGHIATVFASGAGGATTGTVASTGWQFGAGATDHGGGSGVIGIDDATTDPTSNPTGGAILYSSSGSLHARDSSGHVTDLTEVAIYLSSDFTSSSTSMSATNLSVPVKSGETWRFEYQAAAQANSSTGFKYEIVAPAGSTASGTVWSTTGSGNFAGIINNSVLNTPFPALHTIATTAAPDSFVWTLTAGADGSVVIEAASATSGQTLTIFKGASLTARRLAIP